MYLISGNITSNVTGNLLVITGNGNIGNITSNFRTLIDTISCLNCYMLMLYCLIGHLIVINRWPTMKYTGTGS